MSLSFRPACASDAQAVIDLAVESVSRDPLPVTVDREAMRETFMAVVGKPAHFVWVGEQDGVVVAAVAAVTQQSFWFTRQQCSVLLYYSRAKGAGMPLLQGLVKWIKSRPVIKLAVVELEPGASPALVRAFKRLGFARQSANLTFVRGQA